MKVLFLANRNVFSWPLSSNVISEPPPSVSWLVGSSGGTIDIVGGFVVVLCNSPISGSFVVVCKCVGSVSIRMEAKGISNSVHWCVCVCYNHQDIIACSFQCIISINSLHGSPRQWKLHSASLLNLLFGLPSQPPQMKVEHSRIEWSKLHLYRKFLHGPGSVGPRHLSRFCTMVDSNKFFF